MERGDPINPSLDWVEVPAEFDANGPVGEGWTRRGGDWVRD